MATSYATTFPLQPARKRDGGLDARRLAAFASLSAPIAAAQLPIANFLPAFYAQKFGISLSALGLIFLFERLWGAFADPLVGVLSDRTRSRFGRRRPWIAGGALIFALATVALFFPPTGVTPLYLGIALFVFYLGWSMVQIPYFAWSGEISGEYHERTRVATFVTVASSSALLVVLLLPALIDHLRPNDDTLRFAAMGGVILVSLLPATWLALRAFPEGPAPTIPVGGRVGINDPLRYRVIARCISPGG